MPVRPAAFLSLFTALPVVLASAGQAPEAAKRARLDPSGDPLPRGARQRLGTLRFRVPASASAVALSPDGKTFAVSESDRIVFYDAASGKRTRTIAGMAETEVEVLVFADNGRKLISVGSKGILIQDVSSGKPLSAWPADDSRFFPKLVSFSADGSRCTIGQRGTEVARQPVVHDLAAKKQLVRVAAVQNFGIWAALSPDGRTLVTGGEHGDDDQAEVEKLTRTVQVWDVATAREKVRLKAAGERVVNGTLSPDGEWLALAGFKPVVQVWNASTGKLSWQADSAWDQAPSAFGFSPDGKRVYAANTGGDLGIWEVSSGKVVGREGKKVHAAIGVGFRPDGKGLAWGLRRRVLHVWDPLTGASLTPGGHTGPIHALGFCGDGKCLYSLDEAGLLRRWQTGTGKRLADFDLRPSLRQSFRSFTRGLETVWIYGKAAFSSDSRQLVVPADGLVVIDPLNGKNNAVLGREHTRKTVHMQVALSADGSRIGAFFGPGCHFKGNSAPALIWDTATNKPIYGVTVHFEDAPPEKSDRQAFGVLSRDGKRVAVAVVLRTEGKRKATLTGWDLPGGKKLGTCTLPWSEEFSLAFAPNGQTVVAAAPGKELFVCDVVMGAYVGRIEGPWDSITAGPVFSRNGRMLAIATDGEGGPAVRVLEWPSRAERLVFPAPPDGTGALAFSPDDRTLASGHSDTTVLLWDLTGKSGAE
jgi:WD40 repeat protein